MPRAIGMGSHLTLVFLRAEFSRERNDSFLWKFCLSQEARVDEKDREGREARAWHKLVLGNRVLAGARMSWRAQVEAMSTSSAWNVYSTSCPTSSIYTVKRLPTRLWRDDGEGVV